MAGWLLVGTDCGKSRLSSIVASRLEPRSQRRWKMPLYTPILRVWCPLNEHTPMCRSGRPVLKLECGCRDGAHGGGLVPLPGRRGDLYRRCRSAVQVHTVHLDLELRDGCNCFDQLVSTDAPPLNGTFSCTSASASWLPQMQCHV